MSSLGFTLTDEQRAFAATHVKLAYSVAHKFSRRSGIPFDDLAGAAVTGLCKAAATFDEGLGYKPSTFIVPKVRGELLHFARDRTYLLKIPHRVRELWIAGRKWIPFGWPDSKIAEVCGVSLETWLDCRGVCSGPPVLWNEAVHDSPTQGAHGKNEEKEDDRSEAILEAVAAAWRAMPREGALLFWEVNAPRDPARRQEALEALLSAALEHLGGAELAEAPVALLGASYDAEEAEPLRVVEVDLGGGRVQVSLFE